MDLKKARELEALRYGQALQALTAQEQSRIQRLNAEMVNRGLQRSDARLKALLDERLNKISQAIDRRIDIRKDLVRNCSELGSAPELKRLTDAIAEDVTRLREQAHKDGLLIAPEVFSALLDRGRAGVENIQQELAAGAAPKARQSPAAGSVRNAVLASPNPRSSSSAPTATSPASPPAAARGSAVVAGNLRAPLPPPLSARGTATVSSAAPSTPAVDAAYAKAEQAIQDTEERHAKLAEALHQLAAAIKTANQPAEERADYLEQVHFIAEQALRPATIRRVSVVKGLLVALRAGLQDAANVAPALNTTGPIVASHFNLRWPSR